MAAALDVALGQLLSRRKAGQGGHRRRPERVRRATRLAVCREQIADIGARVADRAHLPVEHSNDPRRVVPRDHRIAQTKVTVHDRRRQALVEVVREPGPDVSILGSFHVLLISQSWSKRSGPDACCSSRAGERRQAGRRHVGRVDLDERVDEVVAEKASRRLALEPRRQLVGRYVAVEVSS